MKLSCGTAIATFGFSLQLQALTIIPTFDNSITSDPRGPVIEATINAAIAVYESSFSDPITVTITFGEMNSGLGASGVYHGPVSYSAYRAALVSHVTSADDAVAIAHLPTGSANPVNGYPNMDLANPLARALGFSADSPAGETDGTIRLKTSDMNLSTAETDTNKYSLFAVVSHEIDEVLGFSSALNGSLNGGPPPTGVICAEDLFRYDQNGSRSFTTALNATAYFSIDGITDLARFNQQQGLDFQDWYSPGGQTPQVQDAQGTPGATPVMEVELRVLDVIGYTRIPLPVWVDFAYYGSPSLGTFNNPFKTLANGVAAVPASSTVLIKSGSSHETPRLVKALTLQAVGGAVTIGR